MRVVVTGASGYIGLRLLARMRAAGLEPVVAGRRAVRGLPSVPFDLAAPQLAQWPQDADAVVHLAALTGNAPDGSPPPDEVAAAEGLVAWCSHAGVPLLFVSSQTARQDAPTRYGRTKWAIEQRVLTARGIVLRPGLVYGGSARGLFGVLVRTVRSLRLLPAFVPSPGVQPIHVDDLAEAICRALRRPSARGQVLCIAQPVPVTFTSFLRGIATGWLCQGRAYVPVPSQLVRAVNALTGGRIAAIDRLTSLLALRPMDTAASIADLDLQLRPLAIGLARPRRQLLLEALAMTRHVAGRRMPDAARRYVRAMAQLRGGAPLPVAPQVWRRGLLPFLAAAPGTDLAWRLDCATALVEAAPAGLPVVLQRQPKSAASAALSLAVLLGRELLRRFAALALRPVVRRWHP